MSKAFPMLQSLHIANYALIRQLDMDFPRGFSVITGETGAGKSILLGALGLVLGQRADTDVLFDKERKCVIEAEFDLRETDLSAFFRANDLDWDAGKLVARREILPSGKTRSFVNDTPVNLPVLKELASVLVDIHSQHETLSLNSASFQLGLVDSYVKDKRLLYSYAEMFKEYGHLVGELAGLRRKRDDAAKDRDYRQFLYEELAGLGLQEGEQEELEQRMETLSHARTLRDAFAGSISLLEGEDFGLVSRLRECVRELRKVSSYHAGLAEDLSRWDSVVVELDDLRRDLERWSDSVEDDPRGMQACQERLDALYRLEKKHRVEDVSDLIRIRDELARAQEEEEGGQERILQLENRVAELERNLDVSASELHRARQQAARELQKAILVSLAELGMEQSRMEIVFEELPHFSPEGKDRVRLLFSANLGSELKDIAKVASGGELSRIMLAIKSVIHQGSLLGTLILDEIDTGVSGNIAGKVARMMKGMGRYMQVIAITHLPQIAAAADSHYWVYKAVEDGTSVSRMRKLSDSERIANLASMLSNGKPTEAAVRAAEDLVKG